MNIKTFKDGNRLVIVVEGLKDIPSDNELLKRFVGGIVCTEDNNISVYPDSDASSVEYDEEMLQGDILVETSFFTGLLDDCYEHVDSLSKELEVLNSLGDNAELYLKHKFSKMDARAYSEKLSDVQKLKFFEIYKPFMYASLVEEGDVQKAIEFYQ